jgi:hypothetical protein
MQGTKLEQQLDGVFQTLGETDDLCRMLARDWSIYQNFLEEQKLLPEQAEDIPQSSFSMFVRRCEAQQTDDESMHLVLASVRVVLLELGHHIDTLSALSAPLKRKRLSNGKDGHYRFALTRAADPEPVTDTNSGPVCSRRYRKWTGPAGPSSPTARGERPRLSKGQSTRHPDLILANTKPPGSSRLNPLHHKEQQHDRQRRYPPLDQPEPGPGLERPGSPFTDRRTSHVRGYTPPGR